MRGGDSKRTGNLSSQAHVGSRTGSDLLAPQLQRFLRLSPGPPKAPGLFIAISASRRHKKGPVQRRKGGPYVHKGQFGPG